MQFKARVERQLADTVLQDNLRLFRERGYRIPA